ncbi:DDHD domain-containing protein [Plectosphaerella plurivora]|uniref:DDHD domain-containing protein n=1 Tax=Plectosphaerella plurivora TaxID=936078 RepID=A0A9P8V615_9PEZI|nr:DDHD domain-containing protein [Plectosphaerella plurivora]
MAGGPSHSYGPNCRLAPVHPRDDFEDVDNTPPISAQFFYKSAVTIDGTLSQVSLTGTSESKGAAGQLRPFAEGDNNALETAWLSMTSEEDIKMHREALARKRLGRSIVEANNTRLSALVRVMAATHLDRHGGGVPGPTALELDLRPGESAAAVCCPELHIDVSSELQNTFCALARKRQPSLDLDAVLQAVMVEQQRLCTGTEPMRASLGDGGQITADLLPSSQLPASYDSTVASPVTSDKGPDDANLKYGTATSATNRGHVDDGMSGTPFIRVEGLGVAARSAPDVPQPQDPDDAPGPSSLPGTSKAGGHSDKPDESKASYARDTKEVTVGISRLHMVSVPALQMKPIYWSPINDIAVVMRATWFYRDTMLPIPAAVANQLEAGYRDLQPYTRTWSDELRCAVDVGPLGEEKVSHKLWPTGDTREGRDRLGAEDGAISTDPFCAARCFRGEASAEGSIDPEPGHGSNKPAHRSYSGYDVLYHDSEHAFLLKPSLRPSAYYGRRPVAKIMKGLTVGIPVVRGFSRPAWESLYDKKPTTKAPVAEPPITAETGPRHDNNPPQCSACQAEADRGQITDLILVFHGIGQKFAERVESFHFTHAINAFRKEVNTELRNPAVQSVLREEHNGIMVLPVNWRHSLSFEDGGAEPDKKGHAHESFGLRDIEPTSIPAIRRILSDILFDVPYWMSHHKGKMIEALVREANRVYRLWCSNNPGFHSKGRVHLIGHSLGSAMAIEVLSRQPNRAPVQDLTSPVPHSSFFEFDTTNLFLAGSPAGFFLLLERGALIPRRGRTKSGADADDIHDAGVTGEAGFFGCLSVDNIYNILAKEDPVAYLLNGTIDPAYASSLKKAYVPSTATSLFQHVGEAMRSILPGKAVPSPANVAHGAPKPTPVRLPSQLELEVHDFTREELAERRAYLLNDNGQVDYYLHSSGGPLEIQYLNMLSAHSSYWLSRDFIRFICIEVGRRPGRADTIPSLRAQKSSKMELAVRA